MKVYDLLVQLDVEQFTGIIFDLVKDFPTPEALKKQLELPMEEDLIQMINLEAKREGQSISFSFKQ